MGIAINIASPNAADKIADGEPRPEFTGASLPSGDAAAVAQAEAPASAAPSADAANVSGNAEESFGKETLTEMMKQTIELLSAFDRKLKYEVREEAGVVQIEVIDDRAGRVVRKIPADEVVKLIAAMKEQLADRMEVWA
jgi:uncharacterized FlaG/YvyC family protein